MDSTRQRGTDQRPPVTRRRSTAGYFGFSCFLVLASLAGDRRSERTGKDLPVALCSFPRSDLGQLGSLGSSGNRSRARRPSPGHLCWEPLVEPRANRLALGCIGRSRRRQSLVRGAAPARRSFGRLGCPRIRCRFRAGSAGSPVAPPRPRGCLLRRFGSWTDAGTRRRPSRLLLHWLLCRSTFCFSLGRVVIQPQRRRSSRTDPTDGVRARHHSRVVCPWRRPPLRPTTRHHLCRRRRHLHPHPPSPAPAARRTPTIRARCPTRRDRRSAHSGCRPCGDCVGLKAFSTGEF